MSEPTRYRRRADCGHDYMAVRPQGRRHKLCPCCVTRGLIAAYLRPCAGCGVELGPDTSTARGGRNRKFCRGCDGRRYEPLAVRPCKRCGIEFQTKSDANVFCSAYCYGHIPAHPERACEFSECGQLFRPVNMRQKSCSPAHARKAWAERNLERDADGKRDRYHRRRALRKGAATGAPVIRSEIAERDEWICHLCNGDIPRDAAWPDPFSLSLDHVIPLSKHGIHDPSNVKAAHLRCNVAKGAEVAA